MEKYQKAYSMNISFLHPFMLVVYIIAMLTAKIFDRLWNTDNLIATKQLFLFLFILAILAHGIIHIVVA